MGAISKGHPVFGVTDIGNGMMGFDIRIYTDHEKNTNGVHCGSGSVMETPWFTILFRILGAYPEPSVLSLIPVRSSLLEGHSPDLSCSTESL
jgi:hypothetical protein